MNPHSPGAARKLQARSKQVRPRVVVYSDLICPFCYIGEKNLERVREACDFEMDWRGFEIHPEIPPGGVPLRRLGAEYIETVWSSVEGLAAESGIPIKQPVHVPNSRLAIEAAEFARSVGKPGRFNGRVFEAYFQEGLDIGDLDVLQSLAKESDIDASALKACLEEGRMAERVEANRRKAEEQLVSAVPTFVFGGYALMGAQPVEVLLRTLKRTLLRKPPS